MPFITINRGGPSADNDVPDGVYPLILSEIKDPRTVSATRGPNAGKDIALIDWVWAIDKPGHPLDSRIVESSTSTASGPKSKLYSYLTALFGGVSPAPETTFEKDQLIGRHVFGTVNHDEDGWVRLSNISAIPREMLQQQFAQVTGTPLAAPAATPAAVAAIAAAAPAVVAPTAAGNDLPF